MVNTIIYDGSRKIYSLSSIEDFEKVKCEHFEELLEFWPFFPYQQHADCGKTAGALQVVWCGPQECLYQGIYSAGSASFGLFRQTPPK